MPQFKWNWKVFRRICYAGAVVLLALMVLAHGGPVMGIRDGSTGKAAISERFLALFRGRRRG